MDSSFQQKLIAKYNRILQEPVENFPDLQIYFINVPENLKFIQSNGMINGVLRKLAKAQDNQEIEQFFRENMDIFQSELKNMQNDQEDDLNSQHKLEDQIQEQQNYSQEKYYDELKDESIIFERTINEKSSTQQSFISTEEDQNKKDPLDMLYYYLMKNKIDSQQFTDVIEEFLQMQKDLGFNKIIDIYNHIRYSYLNMTDIQDKIKLAQIMQIFIQNSNDMNNKNLNQFFTDILLKEPLQDQQLGYYQLYALLSQERVNPNIQNLKLLKTFIDFLHQNDDALILFLKEAYDLPNFAKKRQHLLDSLIYNVRSQNRYFNRQQLYLLIQCQDLKYDCSQQTNTTLQKQLYILQRLSNQHSKEEQLAIIIYLVDNDFIKDTSLLNQLLYPYIKQDQQFLPLFTQLNKIIDRKSIQRSSTGIQMFKSQFYQLDIKQKVIQIYSQLDSDQFSVQE